MNSFRYTCIDNLLFLLRFTERFIDRIDKILDLADRGLDEIRAHYSKDIVTEQYVELIDSLIQ